MSNITEYIENSQGWPSPDERFKNLSDMALKLEREREESKIEIARLKKRGDYWQAVAKAAEAENERLRGTRVFPLAESWRGSMRLGA